MDVSPNTENTPTRSRKKLIITIVIVAVLIFVSFVPAIVCDIRTAVHGDEFETVFGDCRLPKIENKSVRVLRYDDDSAELYYWASGQSGITVSLEKSDGYWTPTEWNVVWQRYGSAHDVIPQYWFHFIYFLNQRRVP